MHSFSYKQWSFYYSIIIYAFLPAATLISMDNPSTKKITTITVQLDDGSQYEIAKWKVKKESNTLCELYYRQHTYLQHTYGKHKNIGLILRHISREELSLFDTALDKNIAQEKSDSFSEYFDGLSCQAKQTLITVAGQQGADNTPKLCALRLTAQLANKLFAPFLIKTHIIGERDLEILSLNTLLKSYVIIQNIQKDLISSSDISSYSPHDCFIKPSFAGAPICMPKVENLELRNFNAQPSTLSSKDLDDKKCSTVLISKNHFIIQNHPNEFFIRKNNSTTSAKITHPSPICRASLSPDGKWLISLSSARVSGMESKLMLSSLDISSDQYLFNFTLLPAWNYNTAPCFNNASDLVVFGDMKKITFFSLREKSVIKTLALDSTIENTLYPLELAFNHDDTRLMGCFQCIENEEVANKHVFIIWDTTNINTIKKLQSFEIDTPRSAEATITFNYSTQDTAAISTVYATFFFDMQSGKLLGQTKAPETHKLDTYAASCSLFYTPITYIAKNSDDKPNYINVYNHRSGDHIGTIPVNGPSIVGLGMTKNGRSLVVTFNDCKTKTIELLSEKENAPIFALAKISSLVDFYGLLEMYRAKKARKKPFISLPFLKYMQNFAAKGIYKEILEKYLYGYHEIPTT